MKGFLRLRASLLLSFVLTLSLLLTVTARSQSVHAAPASPPTYASYGSQAVTNLLTDFYTNGEWKSCLSGCGASNVDWGVDSLTYTLWLRWKINNPDASVVPDLNTLSQTAPSYSPPCQTLSGCSQWSDVPMWDSIALGREYEATGLSNATILAKEKAAFQKVDGAGSSVYSFGACPTIHYQQPGGGANQLKTLETDANYIKAALLLYRYTQDPSYLDKAKAEYAAVRQYFLDPTLPLYSVYVFDNGTTCTQLQGRFFASVNGDMIYNGLTLASDTGDTTYLNEAIATGQAVATDLTDANGVFANLQAENDIAEPLIEGMYDLAVEQHQAFANSWLLASASASASSLASNGTYSRFFDAPPQAGTSTAWQANGGYALAIAAAGIDPTGAPATNTGWANANSYTVSITTSSLPDTITFTGSGIALIGTLGENCCEAGHARVFIDGKETTDKTGIWQNKSSSGKSIPNTVLFAWQWPKVGTHTVEIQPGISNPKEGGSFIDIKSILVNNGTLLGGSSGPNNEGISNDNNTTAANFDGNGFSYSNNALGAAGFSSGSTVTVNGIHFSWPTVAAGASDNWQAAGQVLTPSSTSGKTLAFLGSATGGPSSGTATIAYTDGSTQTFTLAFSDWTLNGGKSSVISGDSIAVQASYRNTPTGQQTNHPTYVFYTSITLVSGKTVQSVTLPTSISQGTLHVFAVSIG